MLQHVTREIPPSELENCISFYGMLGFDQVEVPEGLRGRAVWLQRSFTQIHLMPKPDARPEQGHLAVVVDDHPAVTERLRSAGYEVDPRREHWGSPRSYVRDPAGNLVEVMAWAPTGSAQDPLGSASAGSAPVGSASGGSGSPPGGSAPGRSGSGSRE